jgi:ABC-2 type transport system permease protein
MTQDADPYSAGTALVVLLLWALAAMVAGRMVLRRRDA